VQLLIGKIVHDFLNVSIERVFLIKSLVGPGVALLLFVTQTAAGLTPGSAPADCTRCE